MNNRDKAIVEDLQRFRCLTRDLIADLHFSHLKYKINNANMVLKRLRRDQHITCSKERRQYIYFPVDNHIKKDSTKINHFLMIAEFYQELREKTGEAPKTFIVEPKYAKGLPEPDAFMLWKGMPWHIEIQRTGYSEKQMRDKLARYDHYYLTNEWHKEEWQRPDKKLFPYVWICGVGKYSVGTKSYRVFQSSIEDMIKLTSKKG